MATAAERGRGRSTIRDFASAVTGLLARIVQTYKLGGRVMVAAPALVALVVVPEFAQHVAEIRLGMFDSIDAARAYSQAPIRMAFGAVKLAGLFLAMLTIARFWALGSVRRALLPGRASFGRIAFALALFLGSGFALDRLAESAPALWWPVTVANWITQSALIVFLGAALFEDRRTGLRESVTTRLPTALVMTLLLVAAFAPAQTIHTLNHKLALGAPAAAVWAFMVWDSLVVGVLAALTGAALHVGYARGATWRGWIG